METDLVWVTLSGVFSDYFVTGVKTDKGLSVLLIERGEGIETKPIKTSYSPSAGTTFVTYDNVKVPVENLLGEENKGIYVILSNFNHERWTMACKFPLPGNDTYPFINLLSTPLGGSCCVVAPLGPPLFTKIQKTHKISPL